MSAATGRVVGMEKPDPQSVFQELRRAIERFNQRQSRVRVEGTATETFYGSESPKPIGQRFYHLTYIASDGSQALIQTKHQPKYSEFVSVLTDQKAFMVRRHSPDAPYVLDSHELPGNSSTTLRRRRNVMAGSAYSVGEDDLTRMVSSNDFKVTGASEVERAGSQLIRLDFHYTPNVNDQFNTKGWVLLDPKLEWAVVEYEVENSGPAIPGVRLIASGTASYDRAMAGFPCPTELAHLEYEPDKGPDKPNYSFDFRLEHASHDPIPPDTFTLTGYGLAELDRPPGRPSNYLPVAALAGGAALLLLSLILKRMGRE